MSLDIFQAPRCGRVLHSRLAHSTAVRRRCRTVATAPCCCMPECCCRVQFSILNLTNSARGMRHSRPDSLWCPLPNHLLLTVLSAMDPRPAHRFPHRRHPRTARQVGTVSQGVVGGGGGQGRRGGQREDMKEKLEPRYWSTACVFHDQAWCMCSCRATYFRQVIACAILIAHLCHASILPTLLSRESTHRIERGAVL